MDIVSTPLQMKALYSVQGVDLSFDLESVGQRALYLGADVILHTVNRQPSTLHYAHRHPLNPTLRTQFNPQLSTLHSVHSAPPKPCNLYTGTSQPCTLYTAQPLNPCLAPGADNPHYTTGFNTCKNNVA